MLGKRVVIVGDSNAGKSTLGERLASHLDVPFVELDALYWQPGWQARERDEFQDLLRKTLTATDGWVAAGNYSSHAHVHWPLAETMVWLDYPLRITVPRIVARSWRRWRNNELLWGTNRERFIEQLMVWDEQKSLIAFSLKHHRRRRRVLEGAMRDPALQHLRWVRLRRPRETDAWLAGVLRATTDNSVGNTTEDALRDTTGNRQQTTEPG